MQERTIEKYFTNPSLSSVEKIKYDLSLYGYCTDKTKQQIIDEEKTHAAEILSANCYEMDVPRTYQVQGDDLIDNYEVSLKDVLGRGIDVLADEKYNKPGKDWELKRRKIEKNNLENIINMPEGIACIEISSTDETKPTSELKSWGYSGDTLLRVSYKNKSNQILQRNIVFKTSDIKILNKLRKVIDESALDLSSSEIMLASPLYVSSSNDSCEYLINDIKNFIDNHESSEKPLKYLAKIIRKSKDSKKNSWDIVGNHQVFEDLFEQMLVCAKKSHLRNQEIDELRAGTWQLLTDELSHNKNINEGYSIASGVCRARAIGAIFTSCGGTISMQSEYSKVSENQISRYEVVASLLCRVSGYGSCKSCGVETLMYGCGVYCRTCNQIWCKTYQYSGKQLSHEEVFEKKYSYYFWIF